VSRPKVQRVADGREGGQKAFAKTVDPDKYKIVRIAAATQFQLSELSGNAVGRADLSILINHPLAGGCSQDANNQLLWPGSSDVFGTTAQSF